VNYMVDNTPINKDIVEAEIDRYITWQARHVLTR
jgi:uncharacterized protein (DUF885 family)